MKKYKASLYFTPEIVVVEIAKESKESVWFLNGAREKKLTLYHGYYNSFDEAKQAIINMAEARLNVIRYQLERAKSRLGNAKGLKESKPNQ